MKISLPSVPELKGLVASSIPALVGTVVGFFMLDEHPLIRIPLAIFFGFLLQTFALLLYAVCCAVVARLHGQSSEKFKFELDERTIAAALLAVTVYGLGQYWTHEQSRQILDCVQTETAGGRRFGQFDSAQELIEYCISEYGNDDSSSSDE